MRGTELSRQDNRAVPPLAHRCRPSTTTAQTLARPPLCYSCSEPASRSGLSLSHNDCPSPDHHCGVKVPGLLLRCPAGSFLRSVDLLLHGHPLVCTQGRPLPRSRPVTRFLVQHFRLLPESPLPFGAFRPLGIRAFNPVPAGKLTFRLRPISLRSPRASLLDRTHGSTFQVRYACGGLLFLKPLGTSIIMHQNVFSVKEFLVRGRSFPQFLCCAFSYA